jgi:hypothetical protein
MPPRSLFWCVLLRFYPHGLFIRPLKTSPLADVLSYLTKVRQTGATMSPVKELARPSS